MTKKDEHAPKPKAGELDIAHPTAGAKTGSVGGGTGAPPDPGLSPDPNQDIARAEARKVFEAKQAAGEDPGERAPGPVALSNSGRPIPTGAVAKGKRRVKVVSPVVTGGVTYAAGDVVDIDESEADSLGSNVESYRD